MLVTEFINSGAIVHNYSDDNKYIIQIETGLKYAETYDTVPCIYTYKESDEELPPKVRPEGEQKEEPEEDTEKLNRLKQQRILQSKYNLQTWLEQHPYKFIKKSGEEDFYTVTEDKQQLLALEIMTDEIKIKSGIECSPSWNAQGKICESWDFNELNRLAIEISDYVKPRVSKQQHTEAEIQEAETEKDIMNIAVTTNIYD